VNKNNNHIQNMRGLIVLYRGRWPMNARTCISTWLKKFKCLIKKWLV